MRRALGALLAALALALVGCSDDDTPGADQARVEVDGSARVERTDGTTETLSGGETLAFGDTVTMVDGTAIVTLAGGQLYELRAGPDPSSIELGAAPVVLAGDVLVAGGFPAQIRYDTMTLAAPGPLQVDASVPSAASYAGAARIDGAGPLDELSPLREVVLTASAVPEPLTFDGSDEWDRRYLGEAIAFGDRLEALARGYSADLPPGSRSASFYESVIPALASEREFGDDLLEDDRSVGDTLVGAAIAVESQDGPFRARWREVFSFRDEGAAWGLVAIDQDVSTAPLLETIEVAITAPSVPDTPSTTDPPPSSDGPSTTAPSTAPTTTSPTPPPSSPPDEPDPPPPSDGLLSPVVDPVGDIIRDLLGALGL